jgi:methylation protein EvaC
LGNIFKKVSYDQIYDEHVFLFSAHSVIKAFKKFGFNLVNIERIDTHGGSMRYFLSKSEIPDENINKIDEILEDEVNLGLTSYRGMIDFSKKVNQSKEDLIKLLSELHDRNIKVAGYAATSKSTTILNFCDIGPDLLECIYDTTPIKVGKFSPGKHIPIIDYNKFKTQNSYKHLFLFAWNHMNEIMAKEKEFSNIGKWLTHVPEVRIL